MSLAATKRALVHAQARIGPVHALRVGSDHVGAHEAGDQAHGALVELNVVQRETVDGALRLVVADRVEHAAGHAREAGRAAVRMVQHGRAGTRRRVADGAFPHVLDVVVRHLDRVRAGGHRGAVVVALVPGRGVRAGLVALATPQRAHQRAIDGVDARARGARRAQREREVQAAAGAAGRGRRRTGRRRRGAGAGVQRCLPRETRPCEGGRRRRGGHGREALAAATAPARRRTRSATCYRPRPGTGSTASLRSDPASSPSTSNLRIDIPRCSEPGTRGGPGSDIGGRSGNLRSWSEGVGEA